VVVEPGVREKRAQPLAKAGLVERACHSHPLTAQLCLQSGVEAGDTLWVVQVLPMAQGLGAKVITMVAKYSVVGRELTTEAMEAGVHTGIAPEVLGAQASSSFATELLKIFKYL
jgi:hypothetical protein